MAVNALYLWAIMAIAGLWVACCDTPPEPPRADLNFTVMHHEWHVPYAQTYLKRRTDTMSLPYFYNDSPHTFDTSLYADAAGKGLFAQLPADTYYVYARAYDHIWGDSVAGGKTVVVPPRDSLLQIIVAVSE